MTNAGFIAKFIKFCLVGGSGVVVDFGITYVGKELLRLNKYVANSLGFICAATSNFILNRIWTFESTNPDVMGQYARFFTISLIGLALNNGIIWLLNDRIKMNFHAMLGRHAKGGAEQAVKLNFYGAKLCAIAVVTTWNFLMNYFFTF